MRKTAIVLLLALVLSPTAAFPQAGKKPAPTTRKPAPPATTKPAPAAKPEPPPPPPPSDIRFKATYTTGEQVTESVTYIRGTRERYEMSDNILIRQNDLKRSVQISRSSNTYLIMPDAEPAPDAATGTGVVVVETSIADVGERKTLFGQEARRVVTVIDRQPQAGACDQMKQKMETDAWYIDAPKAVAAQPPAVLSTPSAAACKDTVKVNITGDNKLIGFPISYSATVPGADGKPVVMKMEVTEFEITNLEDSLFDIPAGLTEATNRREMAKAVSDANEVKLASAPATAAPPKKPGMVRVAVPELVNKTTQQVDTRALRTQLISELAEQKMEGIPLAAASPEELTAHAKEMGCDYLLVAQITDLKASKPGRLGRLVKKTAGESTDKDVTEAKLNVQLTPVAGGKPRMTATTEGNDGGIGFKTGLRLAQTAAMMYLRYASPLGAMNTMSMMNMGGMGLVGNPMLMQMQGAGVMGTGRAFDRTAGAAMFMMDAMATGSSGASEGPSFDASLSEALEGAAKKAKDSLPR